MGFQPSAGKDLQVIFKASLLKTNELKHVGVIKTSNKLGMCFKIYIYLLLLIIIIIIIIVGSFIALKFVRFDTLGAPQLLPRF